NVDVAYAAPTGLVDEAALALDPLTVAGGSLVANRLDGCGPRLVLAVAAQGEHDLVAGLVHQALTRRDLRPQPLPIDRQEQVARADVEAGGEGGGGGPGGARGPGRAPG